MGPEFLQLHYCEYTWIVTVGNAHLDQNILYVHGSREPKAIFFKDFQAHSYAGVYSQMMYQKIDHVRRRFGKII